MYNSIRSSRPVTASLTAHYTGLLKSTIKRRKAGNNMKGYKVMVRETIKLDFGCDYITSEYSGVIKITKASAKREMLWARYEGYDAYIVEVEI